MSEHRHTIAAVIPARNCPELLHRCLQRLDWVDEILVQDASTDDRIARLLRETYPLVKYVADADDDLRRRLWNHKDKVSSDFILWVCTDEFYSPSAGQEILTALRKPCMYDGFEIAEESFFVGTRLPWLNYWVRLVRRDVFFWEYKSMHEMPSVPGAVGRISNGYEHHNNPTLGMVATKNLGYESADAAQLSDEELKRLTLDGRGRLYIWWSAFVGLLRINVRFARAFWAARNLGFAGVCLGYANIYRAIAHHVAPTEELRRRQGKIDLEDRGY